MINPYIYMVISTKKKVHIAHNRVLDIQLTLRTFSFIVSSLPMAVVNYPRIL